VTTAKVRTSAALQMCEPSGQQRSDRPPANATKAIMAGIEDDRRVETSREIVHQGNRGRETMRSQNHPNPEQRIATPTAAGASSAIQSKLKIKSSNGRYAVSAVGVDFPSQVITMLGCGAEVLSQD